MGVLLVLDVNEDSARMYCLRREEKTLEGEDIGALLSSNGITQAYEDLAGVKLPKTFAATFQHLPGNMKALFTVSKLVPLVMEYGSQAATRLSRQELELAFKFHE